MIARHVKLRLNKKQQSDLETLLWRCTGIYNWTLKTIELRKSLGLPYSEYDLYSLLAGHSKKCEVSSAAIRGTVNTAFCSWERCWKGLAGKPKLKGNRNKLNSIQFRMGAKESEIKNGLLKLPGLGWLKFHQYALPLSPRASTVRVCKRASGWYAVLLFKEEHKQVLYSTEESVGIDPGFKTLLTLSNGLKFNNPREFDLSAAQLAKVQRGICGKERRGSEKTARKHEKIANQRKDRNHKISHAIVRDYKNIYIAEDNYKAFQKRFGRSVLNTGGAQLTKFIVVKGSSCGRKVELVSNSCKPTKTCSKCLALTGPSGLGKLNVRHWKCSQCGMEHDRDINAAINTLNAGRGYRLELLEKTSTNANLEHAAAG